MSAPRKQEMSNILVPLYIYPAPGAWQPLYRIIEHRPDLSFTIVVNPNNGPSVPGLDGRPDDNYVRELRQLNNYRHRRNCQILDQSDSASRDNNASGSKVNGKISAVRIIGYVATTYGQRSADIVKRDIETYANWSRLNVNGSIDDGTKGDIGGTAVQGIFFDETPNNYDPSLATCLASFHAAVKEKSGLGEGYVVDNPGCLPDERYYDKNALYQGGTNSSTDTTTPRSFADLADLVVVFEDSFATFNSRIQSGEFGRLSPKSPYAAVAIPLEKRACIVHSVPTNRHGASLSRFLSSLSPKSSSSSLSKKMKDKKGLLRDDGTGAGAAGKADEGEVAGDRRVAALGRALMGLAGTVYVTDVERDYYAKFSERMEGLCGPWC